MADALAREIDAFQRLLPRIRTEYGSVWAVIAHEDLQCAFPDFSSAAKYALANCSDTEFLIRHTDLQQAHIPYVAVED